MIGKIPWLIATLLLAYIQLAEAQQPKKIPRIGWLTFGTSKSDRHRPFFEGFTFFGLPGLD
jgi:predicted small integral membrane protein